MDAKEAIGGYQPEDWHLDPWEHADRLAPAAGPLQRILSGSALHAIMHQYEDADSKAQKFQAEYKRIGSLEIYFTSAAAIIGAIVLYLVPETSPLCAVLRTSLLLIQMVCISGAVAAKYQLSRQALYTQWQRQRSNAETVRIDLFETVCGIKPDAPQEQHLAGELPLLQLQLEYFLRYQLQVQLNYYQDRGRQHEVAARQFINRGTLIIFIVAVAASLTGMAAELGGWVSTGAFIGLVAPILLAAQTSLSRLNQDERNAARYAITSGHLQNLQKRVDAMRKAAAAGEATQVREYLHAVNEVVSIEHKEWIEHQASNTSDNEAVEQ